MDTGSNAKKEILLGEGLNALHRESTEWLNTIAFWKDEAKFFKDLLDRENVNASEYGQMLQYMDKVHQTLFDYLAEDIVAHESLLSRLIEGQKGISDQDYREKHTNLRDQMDLFTKDFIELKKMVFGYAKKL
ncbi:MULTISPECIES: hypothetical protein [unclassified Arenibacter]|jgi:hypothetical protein|uniref:hypothetical protein n=1 Tax=unclassified Arenibacter TaxID=2615047 RepID=UPI000E34EEE8|nr:MULTISPECIES: hypothetical protein [unclassified Arenibacter]MCM4163404.1 hypothetical protein [Arenibacter sp. A80]RFT57405.1 hypothetical protein D0S24_07300 [Arenibacter sp. P308M17]